VGYQWTSVHQRHDTGQEGVRRGIPIPCQLGVRRGFEKLVDVRVTQLPVPAHVSEVVAAELADAGNDNDRVPSATEAQVGVLDDKIASTGLALGLSHRRYDVALCGQARVTTDLLQRIQDRLVGILRADD
jgi:hypothetical protein